MHRFRNDWAQRRRTSGPAGNLRSSRRRRTDPVPCRIAPRAPRSYAGHRPGRLLPARRRTAHRLPTSRSPHRRRRARRLSWRRRLAWRCRPARRRHTRHTTLRATSPGRRGAANRSHDDAKPAAALLTLGHTDALKHCTLQASIVQAAKERTGRVVSSPPAAGPADAFARHRPHRVAPVAGEGRQGHGSTAEESSAHRRCSSVRSKRPAGVSESHA
jgi:hypothetical protein